ncbi:CHAT domain-containing protein [Tumidithrix helvetica PCC 7403]|uniref:CHAT domain-containing protein n=1 Tax=Tumidithrix helvetica TaxID=3457545 RepID=UPI003C91030E
MKSQQEVNQFLQGKSALELIQSFDTEFDIPFKHGQCIGLLEMLGAYEALDQSDALNLAEYVGAWWCRIVRADVTYNILDGLEAIQSSKNDAKNLCKKVEKAPDKQLEVSYSDKQIQMMDYIAARWHDGAAKIHYRCNDHTEARLLFQKAREIAQRAELWYCLPDIQSNCLRVEYEELRAVGRKSEKDLKTQYKELRDQTSQVAKLRSIDIPDLDSLKSTYEWSNQEKEFLRGLSSILHNFSVELKITSPEESEELKKMSLEESDQASKESEVICRALGDAYRLAQALNHQAQLASGKKDWESARKLFEEVCSLPWQRGKLIATQNLAKIEAEKDSYHVALQKITDLLDQIEKRSKRRGGDLGFDSDFYYFTVQAFEKILKQAKNSMGQEDAQRYQTRWSEEQLQMVRSIRKVVKITTYKTSFSQRFYPIYLELIGNYLQQLENLPSDLSQEKIKKEIEEVNEKTFSLIEEASSRELLDILSFRTLSNNADVKPNFRSIDLSRILKQDSNEPQRGRRGMRVFGSQEQNPKEIRSLNEQLNERSHLYEASSLDQSIATSEPNPDIAYEIRMFTANQPGLVIVRYFFCKNLNYPSKDPDKPEAPLKLAAYVFRDGEFYSRQLEWAEIKKTLIDSWEETWGSKSESRFRRKRREYVENLSRLLIKPLWSLIVDENTLNKPSHLVLIPSEELFRLPLHVALVPRENISHKEEPIPLAAYVPLSFSVSATAYVTRSRHLLRRQRVEKDDDLCVLMKRDEQVSGNEIASLEWPESSFHIAGQPPENVYPHCDHGQADRQGLSALIAQKPEFFTYAGHGLYTEALKSVGPALELEGDCLTQFDIAMGVRLPRNKLTLLGACVSGQGANLGGGEVAGFIRAFIAAGCGALGITLWPVLDESIANTIHHLLTKAQHAAQHGNTFDVVQELYEYYNKTCKELNNPLDRVESCPLALYL